MTDDEHSAALCSIAYQALLSLPHNTYSRFAMQTPMATLVDEIARLRKRNPEDIQNEFERRATS